MADDVNCLPRHRGQVFAQDRSTPILPPSAFSVPAARDSLRTPARRLAPASGRPTPDPPAAPRPLAVLFLTRYGREGASSRYRFMQYEDVFERAGIRCTFEPLFGDGYLAGRYAAGRGRWADLAAGLTRRLRHLAGARRYDLVVVQGELVPYLPATLERLLAAAGVPYVVDYDDAIFHYYDQSPRRLVRGLLGGKIPAVVRHARCVVAGNDYLADYARRAGAGRVEVVPTVVDLGRYPPAAPRRDGPFTIGWIGSPSSSRYLPAAAPALAAACRGGRARVILIGAGDVALPGVPVERVAWAEETEVRDMGRFDAGIMPAPDDPWARGKCGLKLIQYMARGLPVVASPVGVNRRVVEHGVNGFLAADAGEWVRALAVLRDRPDRARSLGEAGRRKVEEQYCLDVTGPRLAQILRTTAAAGR